MFNYMFNHPSSMFNILNLSTFRRVGYGKTIPAISLASEDTVNWISDQSVVEDYTASDTARRSHSESQPFCNECHRDSSSFFCPAMTSEALRPRGILRVCSRHSPRASFGSWRPFTSDDRRSWSGMRGVYANGHRWPQHIGGHLISVQKGKSVLVPPADALYWDVNNKVCRNVFLSSRPKKS